MLTGEQIGGYELAMMSAEETLEFGRMQKQRHALAAAVARAEAAEATLAEIEAALGWCIEYQAVVTFFYCQGSRVQPRVTVRIDGGIWCERDDLVEAVAAVRERIE